MAQSMLQQGQAAPQGQGQGQAHSPAPNDFSTATGYNMHKQSFVYEVHFAAKGRYGLLEDGVIYIGPQDSHVEFPAGSGTKWFSPFTYSTKQGSWQDQPLVTGLNHFTTKRRLIWSNLLVSMEGAGNHGGILIQTGPKKWLRLMESFDDDGYVEYRESKPSTTSQLTDYVLSDGYTGAYAGNIYHVVKPVLFPSQATRDSFMSAFPSKDVFEDEEDDDESMITVPYHGADSSDSE